MSDPFAVAGLSDLQAALDTLPIKIEKNILRGALRAGAKVQLQAAKSGVPVETDGEHPGALRDSLRITTGIRGGTVAAKVHAGGKGVYWAHWVEFGTAAHLIMPAGRKSLFFAGLNAEVVHHPGARMRPYMRPALDGTAQEAVGAVAEYIRARLTKQGIEVPAPLEQGDG